ncbi:hypothetical protein BT96DRAFT_449521 [Gymnopus androsaceus JB14]|uniref:Zn(2)-C6 fungal-type domain-containing protein n=1 Tax=Gymnopus androsaceus JB14 TaxID=1447944 RepID=A0A6A4GRH3_9AGAR|nr:hypothetical protein BT96DRAFT_449521 [Gymnopus androsaceus JB14]
MISMTSSGGQSAPESRFSRPLKRGGACLTCRRLKIRCDGARPCGSCQRKPKDDPSRTRAIEDKISRLEARIREYGCPDSPSVAHTPLHSPYTLLKKDIDNHSLASINRKKGAIAREAGNVKFKAGNFAGAIEDYEKAIKSDPADTLAHNNRAAAYTELFAFIASENKRRRARDTQSRPLKVMTDAPQPPTRMTISTPSNFIFPGSPTLSSDSPYFTPSNSLSEHYLSSSSSCTTPPPLIRAPSSPTLSKNNFNLLSDIERRPKKGNENSVDPKSMLDPPRQHGHSASAPTVLPIPHESIQIPDPPCLTSSLLATISRDNGNPEDVMSDFDLMPNNENHEDSVRIWDAPTGILEHVDSQSSKSYVQFMQNCS